MAEWLSVATALPEHCVTAAEAKNAPRGDGCADSGSAPRIAG
jgi:hypothetical protein